MTTPSWQASGQPICAVVPIAPSTYYLVKARDADPARTPEAPQ